MISFEEPVKSSVSHTYVRQEVDRLSGSFVRYASLMGIVIEWFGE